MIQESYENLDVRDVIIYNGKRKECDGTESKDTKRRPAVIICSEEIDGKLIAVPLNSKATEAWNGPKCRYCLDATKPYVDYLKSLSEDDLEKLLGQRQVDLTNFSNIEKISQVAVNNAFYVEKEHVKRKIGKVDSGDYEIIRYLFQEYCAWLETNNTP